MTDQNEPPNFSAVDMAGQFLLGVNLAGAEFGPPYDTNGQRTSHPDPGVFGTNYTYPTHAEIDYYAAKGMSVVRLPFLWERIQPTQSGALDAAELGRLDDVVSYATGKGLKIEIELHDYGYGFGSLIGSAQTPNSSFADVWGKLAGHFSSNPDVIFGLMNEPHVQSAADWLVSANAAIAAIRSAGAMQEILVPGTDWDGGWSWTSSDSNNATVMGPGVVDPGHNFAFEVHQYLDSDSSGTHPGVVSPTIGVERLTAITQWAEANHQRLFLGEIGVDTQATSLEALDNTLTYIKQHTDVWSGVTYWAGGPWWGDYMFSIEPQNGADKPQMGILVQHLGGHPTRSDFNGDGTSDILWHNDNGAVGLWSLNGGQVGGVGGVGAAGPDWHLTQIGDFNGDGTSDILWRNDNGAVGLWSLNGGQVGGVGGVGIAGPDWHLTQIGDFNGDGKSDLLWQNDNGAVGLWELNGNQVIGTASLGALGDGWHLARPADFNGDGTSDLLWHNDNGATGIWELNGGQVIGVVNLGTPSPDWKVAGTGDFNGDGTSDILWRNDNGAVGLWELNGGHVIGSGSVGNAGNDWHIADTGDYNGDGKSDILWHNDNGATGIWELNGAQVLGAVSLGNAGSDWHVV